VVALGGGLSLLWSNHNIEQDYRICPQTLGSRAYPIACRVANFYDKWAWCPWSLSSITHSASYLFETISYPIPVSIMDEGQRLVLLYSPTGS
jgi:hypothetical protein